MKAEEEKFKLELMEKEREMQHKLEREQQEVERRREETRQRINERQQLRAQSLKFMKQETKKISNLYALNPTISQEQLLLKQLESHH